MVVLKNSGSSKWSCRRLKTATGRKIESCYVQWNSLKASTVSKIASCYGEVKTATGRAVTTGRETAERVGHLVLKWTTLVLESVWRRRTFFRLHLLYFVTVCLLGTLLLWLTPLREFDGASERFSFIDAIFFATSAVCVSGLATLDMRALTTFHLSVLLLLMAVGGGVFTSLGPVLVRRRYFRRKLRENEASSGKPILTKVKEEDRQVREEADGVQNGSTKTQLPVAVISQYKQLEETDPSQDLDAQNRGGGGGGGGGGGEGGALGEEEAAVYDRSKEKAIMKTDAHHLDGSRSFERRNVSKEERQLTMGGGESLLVTGHGDKDVTTGSITIIPQSHSTGTKGCATSHMPADELHDRMESWSSKKGRSQPLEERKENEHGYTWGGDFANIEARKIVREFLSLRKLPPGMQAEQQRWRLSGGGASSKEEGEDKDGDELTKSSPPAQADEVDPDVVNFFEVRSVEYLALVELSKIVPLYYFLCQFIASLILVMTLTIDESDKQAVESAHANPYFFALFHSVSSFNNAGYGILPDNLVQFRKSTVVLLTLGTLILLGNTMYAPAMRGTISLLHRVCKKKRHVYKYLLDHPRKCFTHLFPGPQTKWLIIAAIATNGIEWFFFIILDWDSKPLSGLRPFPKLLAGLFQSVATRHAGFQVVNIAMLSPAMVVLYCGLMYAAIYPVFLARQQSKSPQEAYDGADICVHKIDWESEIVANSIKYQIAGFVGHDACLLFLSVFLICIIESPRIQNDFNFAIINIIFEVISGFGNVGLSTGYMCREDVCACTSPATCASMSPNYSLSGELKPLSKLILVFVMFLGRHRGLPDNIDSAIVIPTTELFKKQRSTNFTDPWSFWRGLQGGLLLRTEARRSVTSGAVSRERSSAQNTLTPVQ